MPRQPALLLPLLLALLAGCGDTAEPAWSGYAEADYVYVAAPLAGTLARLDVEPGQAITAGQPLFALESEAEAAARDEAQARLAGSQAQAANTGKGKRDDEIAITQAQLAQARAQVELAQRDNERKRELLDKAFISRAQLDESRTALAQARARVAELEAALKVARLPARTDERAAAQAQVDAAQQVLRQTQWRERQKQQAAPVAGQVSDTFFRPGEFVAAGQPVVALLPPANLKARFFVPQAELSRVALGKPVQVSCDGCGAAISAKVVHVASQPEYTPPVIYSNAQKAKLVFMVEARPAPADAPRLRPGQPLQVRPGAEPR